MSRKRLRVVVVASVVLAAAAGAMAARWPSREVRPAPPGPAQPALTVDPHHLDFGEVWEPDQFELPLPIRNNSATPLRLTEWGTSCNCLGVEPRSLEFGPHEVKTATAKLDLASKLRMNPTAPQAVAVDLSGTLADGTTVAWRIRGVVKPLVKTYPDLSFQPRSELAQPYEAKRVDLLEFTEPVSVESLESDSPFITPALRDIATPQQTRLPIELRFAPAIPTGEHRFTLSVRVTTRSPRQQVIKRLGGVLRVTSDVQADPGQVVFPAKAVGDQGEEVVVLRSLTGRAVHIESVAVDGDGLAADRVEGDTKLVIRQRSTTVGQRTTRVRVVARSDGRVYDVVIPVTSLWLSPG